VVDHLHEKTCCMGFLERTSTPYHARKSNDFCTNRDRTRKRKAHGWTFSHLSDVSVYIYFRHSDTSGWRRPRSKAKTFVWLPQQTSLRSARRAFTVCDCHGSVLWETPTFLHSITNARRNVDFCLRCTYSVRGYKRLPLVRWFERFWEILQKLLDSFGVGC